MSIEIWCKREKKCNLYFHLRSSWNQKLIALLFQVIGSKVPELEEIAGVVERVSTSIFLYHEWIVDGWLFGGWVRERVDWFVARLRWGIGEPHAAKSLSSPWAKPAWNSLLREGSDSSLSRCIHSCPACYRLHPYSLPPQHTPSHPPKKCSRIFTSTELAASLHRKIKMIISVSWCFDPCV